MNVLTGVVEIWMVFGFDGSSGGLSGAGTYEWSNKRGEGDSASMSVLENMGVS